MFPFRSGKAKPQTTGQTIKNPCIKNAAASMLGRSSKFKANKHYSSARARGERRRKTGVFRDILSLIINPKKNFFFLPQVSLQTTAAEKRTLRFPTIHLVPWTFTGDFGGKRALGLWNGFSSFPSGNRDSSSKKLFTFHIKHLCTIGRWWYERTDGKTAEQFTLFWK